MEITPRYNLRQNIKQRVCRNGCIFSRLPDEVIIFHILSRLMPREAAQSCLISRRWRSLWQQSMSCRLVFTSLLGVHCRIPENGVSKESHHFVSWVNNILDLRYHNPTIDEFIVKFDLDSSFSRDINNWLNFAFRSGVRRLELNLSPYLCHFEKDYYAFPGLERLSAMFGLESNHGVNLNTPYRAGLDNLREISFKHVDVDGEAIEYMLSKCYSLEHLCVKNSNTLLNLNVCGDAVGGLKHLEIVDCENAENVKISVPSLVLLKYSGPKKALQMKYVPPSLSEICIGGKYCRAFLRKSAANLNCVAQLKKLKLDMTYKVVKICIRFPLEFPTFPCLEQLEVKMEMGNGLFLLWPTILIKAAPTLHTFVIKLKHNQKKLETAFMEHYAEKGSEVLNTIVVGRTPRLTPAVKSKIMNASKQQHECLKVVEIRRFVGNKSDFELVKHLLSMPFQSLEKLVLVTSPHSLLKNSTLGLQYQKISRKRAKLVRSRRWLPSSTELVIH